MPKENDVRAMKQVRMILGRRGIDITRADVRVQNGVCHIRGFVSALPTFSLGNMDTELQQAAQIIRQRPEVTNVIIEVAGRG